MDDEITYAEIYTALEKAGIDTTPDEHGWFDADLPFAKGTWHSRDTSDEDTIGPPWFWFGMQGIADEYGNEGQYGLCIRADGEVSFADFWTDEQIAQYHRVMAQFGKQFREWAATNGN